MNEFARVAVEGSGRSRLVVCGDERMRFLEAGLGTAEALLIAARDKVVGGREGARVEQKGEIEDYIRAHVRRHDREQTERLCDAVKETATPERAARSRHPPSAKGNRPTRFGHAVGGGGAAPRRASRRRGIVCPSSGSGAFLGSRRSSPRRVRAVGLQRPMARAANAAHRHGLGSICTTLLVAAATMKPPRSGRSPKRRHSKAEV